MEQVDEVLPVQQRIGPLDPPLHRELVLREIPYQRPVPACAVYVVLGDRGGHGIAGHQVTIIAQHTYGDLLHQRRVLPERLQKIDWKHIRQHRQWLALRIPQYMTQGEHPVLALRVTLGSSQVDVVQVLRVPRKVLKAGLIRHIALDVPVRRVGRGQYLAIHVGQGDLADFRAVLAVVRQQLLRQRQVVDATGGDGHRFCQAEHAGAFGEKKGVQRSRQQHQVGPHVLLFALLDLTPLVKGVQAHHQKNRRDD